MTDDTRAQNPPAGTATWHRRLEHIPGGELGSDTAQSPGMRRYEAISGRSVGAQSLWMGRTHVGPATSSGDHHHGRAETAIYVVSGHPVFVFAEGDEEVRIETEPGDYVFVPPYLAHREENPSPDEEAMVVIARSTQEGIVVNLPSLWARIDRPE
ncbi:MAG TPA: cupin domain-containing protein [Actinomadura sp.]|nr:cupin domain-containing protein [Actinomadura sp.]